MPSVVTFDSLNHELSRATRRAPPASPDGFEIRREWLPFDPQSAREPLKRQPEFHFFEHHRASGYSALKSIRLCPAFRRQ